MSGGANGQGRRLVVGIDTGGTFTDVVLLASGGLGGPASHVAHTLKVPSTPRDPAEALLRGLREVLAGAGGEARIVHGTTVATNALLEHAEEAERVGSAASPAGERRTVARTALVTNRDMEDLVEIGRQARPDLYALHPRKPAPLVPRELRFGVGERLAADGREIARESDAEVDALARALAAAGIEAVAVCLLHSYRDPGPERRIAARLAGLGVPITVSGDLLPEVREVERFETAIANAALTPVLSRYLERVERELELRRKAQRVEDREGSRRGEAEVGLPVLVMRSDGGLAPAADMAREPVRTLLSGPAGGLVGAARAARRAGLGPFISIDVGGTSTDVALSGAEVARKGEVGGVRVAVPALDIVSVGAGGGSIAWVDAGGALRVGPRSAGADPGPACYGKGRDPTLTDAALLLGRLDPRLFLGGALAIDRERARDAVERVIAGPLRLPLVEAAAGVVEVALAATERALRRVSIERGEDPRRRALVAFGGAGGLLAAPLAERLEMGRVLVPEHPGLLSALGMAEAPLLFERSTALLAPLQALAGGDLDRAFQALEVEVIGALARERVPRALVRLVRALDARYEGQSHEIRLPYRAGHVAADFHAAHERRNGFHDDARAIEVVAAHVAGLAGEPPDFEPPTAQGPAHAARPAQPFGHSAAGPVFRREDLDAGATVAGPAVIGEYSGTTWVPFGWRATKLDTGDLFLELA